MTMTKLINYCEKEKKILDDKKEQEEWEKKSKEEKEKILKEQEIAKKNIEISETITYLINKQKSKRRRRNIRQGFKRVKGLYR